MAETHMALLFWIYKEPSDAIDAAIKAGFHIKKTADSNVIIAFQYKGDGVDVQMYVLRLQDETNPYGACQWHQLDWG